MCTLGASDSVVLLPGFAGRARIFAGVADLQGEAAGSSPTSGTRFPRSGACGPLSVHKLFTYGPIRGPFSLVAGGVASCLLSSLSRRFVLRYLLMDGLGRGNMTRGNWSWVSFLRRCLFTRILLLRWWWLSCLFMAGPGEGGMKCALSLGSRPTGLPQAVRCWLSCPRGANMAVPVAHPGVPG